MTAFKIVFLAPDTCSGESWEAASLMPPYATKKTATKPESRIRISRTAIGIKIAGFPPVVVITQFPGESGLKLRYSAQEGNPKKLFLQGSAASAKPGNTIKNEKRL